MGSTRSSGWALLLFFVGVMLLGIASSEAIGIVAGITLIVASGFLFKAVRARQRIS